MSHVHYERVRFGDLDALRHLNNVAFLRYFETARIAYLKELMPSLDVSRPEDHDGFGAIFAECHINYRSPVLYDEQVAVHCSIGNVQRSSFRVEFEMRVDGRLAAEGYGVLVGYDYNAGKAAHLPAPLRDRLQMESTGSMAPADH
jgi:acyl-CoA thioester hydrolase